MKTVMIALLAALAVFSVLTGWGLGCLAFGVGAGYFGRDKAAKFLNA